MAKANAKHGQILRKQAQPADPDNPLEVYKAKRQGGGKGKKHRYKSEESRLRALSNLRPTKPGESSRLRAKKEVLSPTSYKGRLLADMIMAVGDEEIEAHDPTGRKKEVKRIELVVRRLYADAIGGKHQAAELLFERGFGKVPQPVQFDLKAEITHLLEARGLTAYEAARDPVLSRVLSAAGLLPDPNVIEGEVVEVQEEELA